MKPLERGSAVTAIEEAKAAKAMMKRADAVMFISRYPLL